MSVILSVGVFVVLGFVLRETLPHSSTVPIRWNAQEYYIPFNIGAFWLCMAAAALAGAIQTLRAVFRDAEKLR